MKLRPYYPVDYPELERISNGHPFPIPNFKNHVVSRVVTDNDNKVVAYGITRNLGEAILICDLNAPRLTRMKALRELLKVAIFGAASSGLEQLHLFIKDEKLAELMKKHFGFKEAEGIVLVKEI